MRKGYISNIRNKKKTLSMVGMNLILAMLVAACSPTGGSSGAGQGTPAQGTPAQGTGTAARDDQKPLDLKVMSFLYFQVPDMKNAVWTEIQKKLNVNLTVDWVPQSDYTSKLDIVLASGDLPDIIDSPENYLPTVNAAKQGLFWDLTPFLGDYKDYPNLKKIVPEWSKYFKIDGKLYSLPLTRPKLNVIPQIRKDWLDKLGLPMPQTMDEFAADLKQIVQKNMAGNGNTIGMEFNDYYSRAFGTNEPVNNSEGGLIYPFLTKNYTDFVAWYRDRYADGVLPKEFSVMKGAQLQDMFTSGSSASYVWNIYHAWTATDALRKKGMTDANVDSLIMKGPKGYALERTVGSGGYILISKKVPEDKVKRILKMFDQSADPALLDLFTYGIEGVDFTTADGVKKLTDVGKKEIDTDLYQFVPIADDRWLKVRDPQASKEWNEAKIKEMEPVENIAQVPLSTVLFSDSWLKVWSKYSDEWTAMRTKAITGAISMQDYQAYVDKLNNMPDFKKAYKEFAESYKQMQQ
ncbi:extracellular solute-binding protein [Paenibacillus cremeus]|uniref:Extracellular solute-binding protein n=1 Tax=Paenibacillus cremeus TaxID=2163881 RepID=A0A559K8C7_9BACL|nr:extracellular solute-binding protein [Paenibacillus cremeus]TVY08379.1 extracellular solute-binding protein [Paenibacillus cremeus]